MADHVPQTSLRERLDAAREQVTVGATYVHYKGGRYSVTGLAIIEATGEVAVIYQADYSEHLTFIRPLSVWTQLVSYQDANTPRFTKVEP